MGYTWGSLLFLVRGGAPGAKDSNDHNHHDGNDPNRDDDDQEHITVQRRGGASMGAVTAWREKNGTLVLEDSRNVYNQAVEPSCE